MSDDTLIDFLHMELVGQVTNPGPDSNQVVFCVKVTILSSLADLLFVLFCRMKLCLNSSTLVTLLVIDLLKG